ncbi:Six-hairpin glycosidase [Lactarius akahatsu]|uniref:Six-hairpin glycosidase n=1 Tax=Lactarius akahatsu TaxID=416441 RepID=A0AAD4LJ76_9AGAM|nr:Six-hairpin glycosidase [Lactarius akahatsu]
MFISWSALSALFLVYVSAQGLTSHQIDTVQQRLAEGATHSWELGTRAQALLELSAPSFSVLTPSIPLPPPPYLDSSLNDTLADVFAIARNAVAALPPPPSNGSGQPFILGDSSVGDPASIGTAVLIANWTNLGGEYYAAAATAQIQYLFGPAVPKTHDGAISHLASQVQLWSDSVYMVPPFLAYYGITTGNQSMLQEAYHQVKLYRSYLRDNSAGGLWQHIVIGTNGTDSGHWSTGNAWAAAGMLRVLGTLKSSPFSRDFNNQIKDLGNWVAEIHSAMYPHLQANGLFKNYADQNYANNFDDASSSALLAATVYRLALLTGNEKYVRQAERTRAALFAANSTSAIASGDPVVTSSFDILDFAVLERLEHGNLEHDIFEHGTLFDRVRARVSVDGVECPEGAQSPEGQAFTLMLQSAWRDWSAAGSPGANVAPPGVRVGINTMVLGAGSTYYCTAHSKNPADSLPFLCFARLHTSAKSSRTRITRLEPPRAMPMSVSDAL